jgi:hypothetical protein
VDPAGAQRAAMTFDTRGLPPGLYFAAVEQGGARAGTRIAIAH